MSPFARKASSARLSFVVATRAWAPTVVLRSSLSTPTAIVENSALSSNARTPTARWKSLVEHRARSQTSNAPVIVARAPGRYTVSASEKGFACCCCASANAERASVQSRAAGTTTCGRIVASCEGHGISASPSYGRSQQRSSSMTDAAAAYQQPEHEGNPRHRHREKQIVLAVCRREQEGGGAYEETCTGDDEQHAEYCWEVSGSHDEVTADHGGNAIQREEQSRDRRRDPQREQCQRVALLCGERTHPGRIPHHERCGVIARLRARERDHRGDAEERADQREVPVHRPQKNVEDHAQRDVANPLHQVRREPHPEQHGVRNDISCGRSRVALHDDAPGDICLAERAEDDREQHGDARGAGVPLQFRGSRVIGNTRDGGHVQVEGPRRKTDISQRFIWVSHTSNGPARFQQLRRGHGQVLFGNLWPSLATRMFCQMWP